MTDNEYILLEVSWVRIAEIVIGLLEGGTSLGKVSGREIVRDMGQKLAELREAQIEEQDAFEEQLAADARGEVTIL